MPIVEAVELRRVRLPLVEPFATAAATLTERDVLLVRVVTAHGDGWGECAALPEPTYTEEYVDGAHAVLREHLAPRVLGSDVTATDLGARLAAVRGHPMAKAALETALLDAELRASGASLAGFLGATRREIEVGAAVGVVGDVDALLAAVARRVDEGYARIKVKIVPGWDVEPVRAVRERFGAGVALQVDANCSYAGLDTAPLEALDEHGLVLVEQPLAADDLDGHVALAARLATPICLDETITSARLAAHALDCGACRVVNVKAGRVGGLLEARRVHDVCVGRGAPAWCGGMLETGIGRAAAVALAALPGFTLPADLSASDRYFRRDLTEPFVLVDGKLTVPDGPGIGVAVDEAFVDECTVWREDLVARHDR